MPNSPQLSIPIKAQAAQAEYEIRWVSYCVILKIPVIITSEERDVKDSRGSGMFQSCIQMSRSCLGISSLICSFRGKK